MSRYEALDAFNRLSLRTPAYLEFSAVGCVGHFECMSGRLG
jgi:hypothetical protein